MSSLERLAETSYPAGNFSIKKDWRGFICEFCPEVLNWARSIKVEEKLNEYKELWFIETEKFLRRLRVASLKVDRLSGSLIKKVRSKNSTYTNGNLTYATGEENQNKDINLEAEKNEKEEFRKSEQRLIIEIAKNPKNFLLYEELGDLYFKSGDYSDAKESYEAAIELNSQNEELKKKLSLALEKTNSQKK